MLEFEEFKQNICSLCNHCTEYQLKRATTTFCYEAYKTDSTLFMTYSYQRLRKLVDWPIAFNKEEECFKNIFCNSKLCGSTKGQECKNLRGCLDTFTSTHNSYVIRMINYENLPFKTRINKPAIIFGGSKHWIKTVKQME